MTSNTQLEEKLCERIRTEGNVFWINENRLGVFDPVAAHQVDTQNYHDVLAPQGLLDLIGFQRTKQPVYWDEIRQAIIGQAMKLNNKTRLMLLYSQMNEFASGFHGRDVDLAWLAQRVTTRALLSFIIEDMTPSEYENILSDQELRLSRFLGEQQGSKATLKRLGSRYLTEFKAGLTVRRLLSQRAKGKRAPGNDFAQTALDLQDKLGAGRAAYVVTTLLTALSGAPGPVSSCLLCELFSRPSWQQTIEEELQAIPLEEICSSPARRAPKTHQFIKEVMRLWGFPSGVARTVKKDLVVDGHKLVPGQSYLLSMYAQHRLADHWDNPEEFDPDRWSSKSTQSTSEAFAPFGWGTRTCVGASVGISQLFLFCHLFTTKFKIEIAKTSRPKISYVNGVATPKDFRGALTVRN